MRLLIVNPNTTLAFTKDINETAQRIHAANTEIVCLNPSAGPVSIESDYDELMSVGPCLELMLPIHKEYDGIIIACYGHHPVIHAAREILEQPVIGIMEASLHLACMVGQTFSIITSGNRAVSMFSRGVHALGLQERCASIRSTDTPVLALEGEHKTDVRLLIMAEALKALSEDKAEVISLGCAGMVGLAEEMSRELGVPVVDGVVAAVKAMEALIGCGLSTSKHLTYAPIGQKAFINMPPLFSDPTGFQAVSQT